MSVNRGYCFSSQSVIVDKIAKKYGWKVSTAKECDSTLILTTSKNISTVFPHLKPHQTVNVFPCMSNITNKLTMVIGLNFFKLIYPAEYDFYPRSWDTRERKSLTQSSFRDELDTGKTFIAKPSAGSEGQGIKLFQTQAAWNKILENAPQDVSYVVQDYISSPLLIDNLKFDFRVYLLVSNLKPIRLHLFKEGLARFCTHSYTEPTSDNLELDNMHLTNYSVNKHSDQFTQSLETIHSAASGLANNTSSKRSIATALLQIKKKNPSFDPDKFWKGVVNVVEKTFVTMWPTLYGAYCSHFADPKEGEKSQCYQIVGFDLMLDSNFKLWLIEINQNPSYGTDSELDLRIKQSLLETAFQILGFLPKSSSVLSTSQLTLSPAAPPKVKSVFRFIKPVEDAGVILGRLHLDNIELLPDSSYSSTNNEFCILGSRNPILQEMFAVSTRVRSMGISSSKYTRVLEQFGLIETKGEFPFAKYDADILYSKYLSVHYEQTMNFMLFCRSLLAVAKRKWPSLSPKESIEKLIQHVYCWHAGFGRDQGISTASRSRTRPMTSAASSRTRMTSSTSYTSKAPKAPTSTSTSLLQSQAGIQGALKSATAKLESLTHASKPFTCSRHVGVTGSPLCIHSTPGSPCQQLRPGSTLCVHLKPPVPPTRPSTSPQLAERTKLT